MALQNIMGNHSLTERFPTRRIQRVQPVSKLPDDRGGSNRNGPSGQEKHGNKRSDRGGKDTDQDTGQDIDQDKGRDGVQDDTAQNDVCKNSKPQNDVPQNDDPINHPAHYTYGGIEVIDFLEACDFPFHLANAVKYISRAGRKDPGKTTEDLSKAVWYINRYIGLLEKRQSETKEGHGK